MARRPEAKAFGFRGVEFGNWVEGKRRQQDLNNAYDALMDLAGILGIPPRAFSLNGTLGLAFGARGRGGVSPAAAHYEPGKAVINLTKMSGAGSLAHEWFHAIDNHLAKRIETRMGRASRPEYVTDNNIPGDQVDGLRPEVVDAFIALRHAIDKTDLKKRSGNIDKVRSKPYWATGIEMHARAFESYVIAQLQDQSMANDYLANIVGGGAWQTQAEMSGLGDSYPYLKASELETVRPAFDALFETIQARETDQGVELYQRDMSRPVASVRSNDLIQGNTLSDRQKAAIHWFRENLVGTTVVNRATGMEVRFDVAGAKESAQRTGDDTLAILSVLPAILENGEYVGFEPDRKKRPNVKGMHRFRAAVSLDGVPVRVIAMVRELPDGTFHYRLAKNRDAGDRAIQPPVGEREARTLPDQALESAASDINIEIEGPEINGVPTSALRSITASVRKILAGHGLGANVSPAVVRGLLSASGVPVLGAYQNGQIRVNANAADPGHVARHEIIHALRDKGLWGKDYGLFTQGEWQALARAARRNEAIRQAVEKAYPDLPTRAQTEEMVAEFYADWATARAANPPGALGAALERIQSLFRAMGAALRGEGFIDAAAIMRDIAEGKIGERAPDGFEISGNDPMAMEQRALSALKEALSRSKGKSLGMIGRDGWVGAKELVSNLLTDAMGRNDRLTPWPLCRAARCSASWREQFRPPRNTWA